MKINDISYSVMHISDRFQENILNTHKILEQIKCINDIEYVDGNKVDAERYIKEKYGLDFNNWNPTDNRKQHDPLPGEFGVWASCLNVYKYIVDNKIPYFLLIEDDFVLDLEFVFYLKTIIKEAPKDLDFLSLFSYGPHNDFSDKTDLNLRYIHKSHNQYSGFQAIIFSLEGAKKILSYLQKTGITYTNDCYVYELSRKQKINGYSIIRKSLNLGKLDMSVDSEIDPQNQRGNDDYEQD